MTKDQQPQPKMKNTIAKKYPKAVQFLAGLYSEEEEE